MLILKADHQLPGAAGAPTSVQGGFRPTVPGFEILAELGRGSMGVVYKAQQLNLNRLVALKMIHGGPGAGDDVLTRFVEEARLVASFRHPNIIQIYEISLEQEPPYFTMELVEGGSLADHIGGRPQPFRQAAQLVETLARAIHVAHVGGIIHRDLKPANILLAPPGSRDSHLRTFAEIANSRTPDILLWTPKITDFGLAKQLDQGAGHTDCGTIMGTPSYMAPEQAEGKSREVGPTADIYSLGAILYELLTGRPPFAAETALETVLQLFQMEPVAPSRLQPKLPRDLETICVKCLHKAPHKRYASADDLAQDLRRFLAGEPITARPASKLERAWKWAQRRPALATLAASASLALVSLLGVIVWHHADLQARLNQARLDEHLARDAQEAASQHERLVMQQDKVKDLLRAGEAALARKDWHNARMQILRARDQVADEPELAELRAHIDRLLHQAEQYQLDRERLQLFQQRRNDALFYATLYTGGDLASTLDETRTAALEALALFGVTADSDRAPSVESPNFQKQEQGEVMAGCYELLLVLADAVAQPRPGLSAVDQRRLAEEGLHILDRAARLGFSTRAYHLRRAQYLAQMGDQAAAATERTQAQTLSTKDQIHMLLPSALCNLELDHFLQGTEEYRQGNWQSAIQAFENVLQSKPDHFWGNYYLALCWLRSHRPDLATARLTACLGWRPDLPWLHLLRGSAWAEMNQFARAEEDYQAALKGPLPEAARYGLFVNRGVLRVRQGRSAEAIEDLLRATALRPQHYQAYVNLAQAFVRDQKLDEALGQLDQAIEREPHLAALYSTRARVHLLRQDEAAALVDLEKAISLEGEASSLATTENQLERGRILHHRKNYQAALAAYDAAVTRYPQHVRAHRLRAETLLELNRLSEALESLDICLKHGRPAADVFRARAAVRTRLGQYPGAQTDYTRALELEPTTATYLARGWAYLVAEVPALALADFEEVIRRDPSQADAYSGRGHARILLGQSRLAIADAEEALRLGPRSPRLVYNVARIYAQAAARLTTDGQRDQWTVGVLQSSWQERAVQLLGSALDMQSPIDAARFWQTYIEKDAAMKSVLYSHGFRQLASRYAAAAGR